MRDSEIAFLEGVVKRSKETRRGLVGRRKTTKAEAAEAVMVAYFPMLLAEIKEASMVKLQFKSPAPPSRVQAVE